MTGPEIEGLRGEYTAEPDLIAAIRDILDAETERRAVEAETADRPSSA